jgi:hypothetical protein
MIITGRITDRQESANLLRIRVEAWCIYPSMNELVASTLTDEQGAFVIYLDEAFLHGLLSRREPEFYFKIFHGDELLVNTQHLLTWRLGDKQKELMIGLHASSNLDATLIPPTRLLPSPTARKAHIGTQAETSTPR